MSTKAERRITGDSYPGVTHPAVFHATCPTCGSKPPEPCVVVHMRISAIRTDHPRLGRPHTRTHRTRLNRWRVAQDRKRGRA